MDSIRPYSELQGRRAAGGSVRSSSGASYNMQEIVGKYSVFRQGYEGVTQPLYDSVTYPQAGTTAPLTLFQTPIGGSTGKTLANTNMTQASQLPASQYFLVDAIRVMLLPAAAASATSAAVGTNSNDQKAFSESGSLNFYIGQKSYFQGAPMLKFPANLRLDGLSALSDTTTAGANRLTKIDVAYTAGTPCAINQTMIPPNEAFGVTLQWPSAVAITANAPVFVYLDGILFRRSQ